MATTIGTYNYTYGSSNQHNRQVQFSRTDPDPSTIQAGIFVLNEGVVGSHKSTIPGYQIDVEMQSTSEKMQAMVAARETFTTPISVPNQKLSELSIEGQDILIRSLKPNGTKCLEVVNDVTGLKIFDPS